MSASVEYFLPLIQCAALVVVHNVVFFDETKSTFLCDWVEGACLLDKVPFNLKISVGVFQVPGMEAQFRLVSVSYISYITIVLVPPVLKGVACQACVGLAVSSRCFSHGCSIYNTGSEALPLYWAGPRATRTVATRLRLLVLLLLVVFQDFHIVP